MLGKMWLFITVVILILALIFKESSLFIVAALLFLASGVARVWSRYSLRFLEFKRCLSTDRVFFGENINLDLTVHNAKFLPLPWLHIREEIPKEVDFLKGKTEESGKIGRSLLSSFLSMGWYHRLTRRYPVQCQKRGYFLFGPVTVNSGDPFGFFRVNKVLEEQDHLMVYPLVLPLEELGIPSKHPFGDLRMRRHLFEDPVQVMTTRDYVSGDPLKRINWKATARVRKLQSKVYEHTTTMDMALFLDTRTVMEKYYWGSMVPEYLETAIITAASISAYAIGQGYNTGLYANEFYWDSNRLIKMPPSDHPEQLKEILEGLAHIKGIPAMSSENLLNREARSFSWETTLVMITAAPTEELITVLQRYRKAGRRIAVVLIGQRNSGTNVDGLLIYKVSENVYTGKLASLRLQQEQ